MRRLALVVLALSFLAVASVSLAQEEWLPCNLRSPFSGGSASGTALPSGARAMGKRGPSVDVSTWGQWAGFDEFFGEPIDEIEVTGAALGFDVSTEKWTVGATLPYASVRNDAPGSADHSGFGDLDVHGRVQLSGSWQLAAGATLPTGDEDEALGFGDPTVRVGPLWIRDKADQAAAGEGKVATLEAPIPESQWAIGGGYEHNFLDSDLALLWFEAGYADAVGDESRRARFIWSVGLQAAAELTDDVDVDGMTRDGVFVADALASVGFVAAHDHFELHAGVRVGLNDDGLRDEIVPTITLLWRTGG